jgi:ATP-binding cassette subfamily B (MDR/TAP) protein 1
MCQTTVETEMEAHYCANSDNWLQNVSFDNCSVFDPPLAPLQMNCQVARLFELFDGADAFSVANLSVLELISQPSWSALRNFSLEQSEPGYAEAYPNYWGCALDGAIIIIAVTFVMQGTFALGQAAKPLGDFAAGLSASASLLKVTNRVSLIDSFSTDGVTPSSVTGTIEVRDVHFAYPTAPDVPVCKGYSLKVEAGQTVALSGPSGSGKSTIISLIERFYDPHSGVVMLDGIDIKTLNVRWLRSQLGLVSQEPVLFQGTVAENIRYGKPDATQAEIEEAARNANAHDFISSDLHMAYETDVGLRGGKLSGGQKQRVAIARALIRKPAVLLLDEATSALDNESERIVQAALDEIMAKQKRTTIVIAHRLSTIRNADKIAVLKEGQVIEEGTHDELLANPEGLYFNLVLGQG